MPSRPLWLTSASVQTFLLLTLWSRSTYLSLVNLGTAMILLPYTWAAGHARRSRSAARYGAGEGDGQPARRSAVGVALLYAFWLVYAGGIRGTCCWVRCCMRRAPAVCVGAAGAWAARVSRRDGSALPGCWRPPGWRRWACNAAG